MHHHTNGAVGLLKTITDDFIALSINWPFGKINRLKCVRVKIEITTVSWLPLFFKTILRRGASHG